uniref:CDCA2 protein n=1 Tax=Schistocephalus solidus TaxID=70667 RepID=A0A183T0X4_SCHSO
LSAAPVMSLSKTAFQQQTAAVDTREKDIFVGVDARSEARSTADPSSASSSRALRKPTLKSMFSPYLEGSVPKDPKFLLFKGNAVQQCSRPAQIVARSAGRKDPEESSTDSFCEVVDVRKLPITRSGRLSVPVLDVGHRQNIVRSSSGLVVKHGEPEKAAFGLAEGYCGSPVPCAPLSRRSWTRQSAPVTAGADADSRRPSYAPAGTACILAPV